MVSLQDKDFASLSDLPAIDINSLWHDLDKAIQLCTKGCSSIRQSRKNLEAALNKTACIYGVNTGFGALQNCAISKEDLSKLQLNLIRSHAVGVGELVDKNISKLMLMLKIYSLALGYSGISELTFQRLVDFYQKDLIPVIPSKGSVGASGDLAPLSHLSLPLIGEGYFWNTEGNEVIPAEQLLKAYRLSPIELQAKDGLALINGTQFMLAHASLVAHKMTQYESVNDCIAALSLSAFEGKKAAFDSNIHRVRAHSKQKLSAKRILQLVQDNHYPKGSASEELIQDPYSLRCIPQVHGASYAAVEHCMSIFEREIHSVTDNPLVFEDSVISGGNFHGQAIALPIDYMALAISELASISERRIFLLLEGKRDLPPFLTPEPGINSGFMMLQYTAAALVSENKILCHPASCDSITTSMGQEDHVSMGSVGARKLLKVLENYEHVLSIELLVASQALSFREIEHYSPLVQKLYKDICEKLPTYKEDDNFQEGMAQSLAIFKNPKLFSKITNLLN
ncbi:MAG: histidine ammonia-lyase [Chlamydiales bacterium]|nr:histidine ammonia-lyase [Chlamydiales bacterium]NCF70437.1 histidine ammonia-lyase [Chlamydiales bacterium]